MAGATAGGVTASIALELIAATIYGKDILFLR
jgi:hypothetical protein